MVETLALFVNFAGVFGTLVYRIDRPNRYAQRTNQEVEEDAKKGSLLGAVVIGPERSLRRREADYMIERRNCVSTKMHIVAGEPPEDTLRESVRKDTPAS